MDGKVLWCLRLILCSTAVLYIMAVFWASQVRGNGRQHPTSARHSLSQGSTTALPAYPPADEVKVRICHEDSEPEACPLDGEPPIIYLVTPTYSRREQIAELTRLAQTLINIKNLHWVIAEDSDSCHDYVINLAERYGMPWTHISSPIPSIYKGLNAEKVSAKTWDQERFLGHQTMMNCPLNTNVTVMVLPISCHIVVIIGERLVIGFPCSTKEVESGILLWEWAVVD